MRCLWIKLRAIGAIKTTYIARILDDCDLHTEADTQIGNIIFPRCFNRVDLALSTSSSKASRHQNRIDAINKRMVRFQTLRIDIANFYFCLVMYASVDK